jgi:hypothetical protein
MTILQLRMIVPDIAHVLVSFLGGHLLSRETVAITLRADVRHRPASPQCNKTQSILVRA